MLPNSSHINGFVLLLVVVQVVFNVFDYGPNATMRMSSFDNVDDKFLTEKEGLHLLHGVLEPLIENDGHVMKSIAPDMPSSFPDNYGGCIVSDRLRFIYIKSAKSAGSTILLGWIRPSLCPPANASDVYRGWGTSSTSLDQQFSKLCAPDIVYPPPGRDGCKCSEIPQWKFEQYFIFTTVRNPYSRMRSSYTYCRAQSKWTDFCQDPKITGSCPQTAPSEPHKWNVHYQFPIHWIYHGWWGWHVDYAIRTENMEQGIAAVADIVNARAAERGEALRLARSASRAVNQQKSHRNRSSSRTEDEKVQLCKYYTGENSICARALEATYDPLVLGYANYCKNVDGFTSP